MDMFTKSFKYFKSKCPPPSYESVIDFNDNDDDVSSRFRNNVYHASVNSINYKITAFHP